MPTRLINTHALQHNFQQIHARAPHAKQLVMVKADAYGHGADIVVNSLPQANGFGVATLLEGIHLRRSGVQQTIVVMQGVFSSQALQEAQQHDLTLVLHDPEQLILLEAATIPVKVWVQIDIGQHLLGIKPSHVPAVWQRLQACQIDREHLCWLGHFPNADRTDDQETEKQIALFQQVTAALPGEKSLPSSAGIFAWPASYTDWIRPGGAIYGMSLYAGKTGADLGLQAVMQLTAPLLSVKTLQAGDAISYGSTWTCPERMRVGMVGIGYGDGYPRAASNRGMVWLHGQLCSVIGTVAMDVLCIDLRACVAAKVGDDVICWGPQLPVETVAAQLETNPYALTTQLTQRSIKKPQDQPVDNRVQSM